MIKISNKTESALNGKLRTISIGKFNFWWPFPIVYHVGSSMGMVLGCPVYGKNTPKIIKCLHNVFRKLDNIKYWIFYRVHPKHKHHIINTKLKPGYYDEDTLILHGCMALLCQYVEFNGVDALEKHNEELRDPKNQDEYDTAKHGEHQADRQEEALNIYRWWKVDKPADEKKCDDLLHELYGKRDRVSWVDVPGSDLVEMKVAPWEGDEKIKHDIFRALEQKIDDDEQKMLHRLIDIRRTLWT